MSLMRMINTEPRAGAEKMTRREGVRDVTEWIIFGKQLDVGSKEKGKIKDFS